MKSSSVYSPFTALALKTVGLVMIVSSLVDYIVLAIPSPGVDTLQREWQLNLITQLVDRGIIPMVGISLLLVGYWIGESLTRADTEPRSAVSDLRFWALLLSSLLGLIFLLVVPLHLNNVRLQSKQAQEQIEQRATQAETQLESQTSQIDAILGDEQKLGELDRAIESGQVQGQDLARLQALKQQIENFKQDPKALNQRIDEAKIKLRTEKQEAEKRARSEALKLGLRTGLSSLLLAIGYIVIGGMGLRSLSN
ncbi:MAG: HpsJ family protein [Coleofasciculaceae cyanobacterium]